MKEPPKLSFNFFKSADKTESMLNSARELFDEKFQSNELKPIGIIDDPAPSSWLQSLKKSISTKFEQEDKPQDDSESKFSKTLENLFSKSQKEELEVETAPEISYE